jgi:PBP1b-binding outer membrane lipoprotein LpoB
MKKIFTLAMVIGIVGSILVGCSQPAAEGETKPAENAAAEEKKDGE